MEIETTLFEHNLLNRTHLAELKDKVLIICAFEHLDYFHKFRVINLLRDHRFRLV